MNYSKPRKCTIAKYTLYLRSLIIKIDKYGDLFSSTKFREENPIPQNFVHFCEELQYISSVRSGKEKNFHSILKFEEINESHGLAIAEMSLRYNINHSDVYKNSGCRIVTMKHKNNENEILDISNIKIEEIFKELKRRGYSGKLLKTNEIHI